jgi:hypothetical protein
MPYLGVKPADEFTSKDLNGEELILDADADTTITADTDDTIDIRIAGADDFQFTANTMSVLSGSTLNIDSGATIANSGTATGFADLSFGGDTFGANKVIGSNDTYSLSLETDGNTAMTISTAGEITKPLQPAFQVIPASNQTNITSGGYTNIDWGTERFDVGSNFASNQFTAPVTGKYQLNVEVRIDTLDTDTADMYYQLFLWTSNAQYGVTYQTDEDVFDDDVSFWHLGINVLADMDASDTAYVRVYQSDGDAQSDITTTSSFSGYLAC